MPSSIAPFSPTKSMIASAPRPSVISLTWSTCFGPVDLYRRVGADLAGQRERLLGRVDDDDLGRGHRLEALDPDVAEPAGADHDRLGARLQHRDRLLDGVDRGQAGVGQRGDVLGLKGIDLDHRARARLQQLGEAAVTVDPGKRAVEAVHVVADPAGPAEAAGDERVHDHRVADFDVGHAGADLVDPAGVLVAGRVWQHDLGPRRPTVPPGCAGRSGRVRPRRS